MERLWETCIVFDNALLQAAAIFKGLEPNGRQTVEAIFLSGLALQMISESIAFSSVNPLLPISCPDEREKCVSAICDARDTMQRLVDASAGSSEFEELRGILDDLNAKVAEVIHILEFLVLFFIFFND